MQKVGPCPGPHRETLCAIAVRGLYPAALTHHVVKTRVLRTDVTYTHIAQTGNARNTS